MASIVREVWIDADAERVWARLRDIGGLTALCPGFVTACELVDEGRARSVTFANGVTAKELIVTIDERARRVVWSSVGGRMTHHNAAAQVIGDGARTKFVWTADLLPDELEPAIGKMIDAGLAAIQRGFA